MKTNKTMRAASFLLVLTLMTSCFVGGTFAKYTTSDTATDSARVAKWGITVEKPSTNNTFTQTYGDTVSANADVVAPGTEGTLTAFTISGTAEVDVKVEHSATLTLGGWKTDGSTEYCPLVFTVGENDYIMTTTVEEFKTAVETAIAAKTSTVDAGTAVTDDLVVKWKWAFEGNDDAKDTALGNLATAPTISLSVTTSVTQVD